MICSWTWPRWWNIRYDCFYSVFEKSSPTRSVTEVNFFFFATLCATRVYYEYYEFGCWPRWIIVVCMFCWWGTIILHAYQVYCKRVTRPKQAHSVEEKTPLPVVAAFVNNKSCNECVDLIHVAFVRMFLLFLVCSTCQVLIGIVGSTKWAWCHIPLC